ncbi:MAG: SDR family oxidoreductase [Euryarchaeota archaeon]|nr:SDR family oxidoreductase [Euryarchaeota archaeon]
MRRFEGRRVVVAGAGPGAGRALAYQLGLEGAQVVVGSRTPERLAETVAIVRKAGGKITSHVADFTVEADVKRFFEEAAKDLGGAVDVVFCLAGGWHEGTLEDATAEEIDRSLNLYFKSAIFVNRYAIPYLGKGKDPCIVNFSSVVGGQEAAFGSTLYNAAKAGVSGLSRSLAADLLKKGIRVNAIMPGAISHKYEPGREYLTKRKLGAAPGAPEDVAHAAMFLASSEASWVTGATLVVDGGWSVNRSTRHPPA